MENKINHTVQNEFRVQGLSCRDHVFSGIPLDHWGCTPGQIDVFVREVRCLENQSSDLPYLLFFQGGPGFGSPRPTEASGWIKKAVQQYRVLLLDQRGTGMSSKVTVDKIVAQGDSKTQANFVKLFRQDSIVRDCELIRDYLQIKTWTVLGQSFGGFCILCYLSFFPSAIKEALITGGLAPLDEGCPAEKVYRHTYETALKQSAKYYARFPKDEQIVRDIILYLDSQPGGGVELPSGGLLTPRLFQCLGLAGLGGKGGFERLHYLIEDCFEDVGGKKRLHFEFLKNFDSMIAFDAHPLYALLQEPIYSCGQGAAPRWAAERVVNEYDEVFNPSLQSKQNRPVNFTAEHIFRSFYSDIFQLRKVAGAAEILADEVDWRPLYDRAVLKQNKVPVAAIAYYDDLYVDHQLAMETAALVNGIRVWTTSEYMHSGLRDDGERIFQRLLTMAKGALPQF